MIFNLPYAKKKLSLEIPDERVAAVLTSEAESYKPDVSESEAVVRALENPIDSKRLSELAKDANTVVVISSDHTRPVPSAVTMPVILSEIRKYNKDVKIYILIATGMHRPTTDEELIAKYGREIFENETIVVHNAYNDGDMCFKGILPSGGELWLNSLVDKADLLVSEGFIEPHFFAGFSGGRKSVLPGIASKKTVLWNHNASFIANSNARAGNLKDNPIHKDMLFAANAAKLAFILNVVINDEKKIINAFAGNVESAHTAGCEFVMSLAKVEAVKSDIVVVTNGGYPLDQNIYQTVKGLSAAERCTNPNGVIIMLSSCSDGHGGEFFYKLLADEKSASDALKKIDGVPASETQFDQWEAQILARILTKFTVIIVTEDCSPKMITDMHMLYAASPSEAFAKADEITGGEKRVTVIPNGISVVLI